MYPGLQSALLAEASTAILLAGAVLLYVTFREKYLVPWIAAWTLYTLSKIFITLSLGTSDPRLWAVLGNTCFALAAVLLALPMDPGPGREALAAYVVIIELLLGIGMMMSVLEDLRIKVRLLYVLNHINSATSSSDEFSDMIDVVADEIMRNTKAK